MDRYQQEYYQEVRGKKENRRVVDGGTFEVGRQPRPGERQEFKCTKTPALRRGRSKSISLSSGGRAWGTREMITTGVRRNAGHGKRN